MGEIKRQLNPHRLYDSKSMEQTLQGMASQGWHLKKANTFFLTYKKGIPTNIQFYITYIPSVSVIDERDNYVRLDKEISEYTKQGWTHVCNYQNMLIFTKESNQPVTLEFTPMEQLEHLSQYICVDHIKSLLLVSLFLCLQILFFVFKFMQKPVENFSSSISIILITWLVNALIVLILDIIYYTYWYGKAKKSTLKKGYIPTMTSKWLYLIWFIPFFIVTVLGTYTSKIALYYMISIIVISVIVSLFKALQKKIINKLRISRIAYGTINIVTAILFTFLLGFSLYQLVLHTDIRFIAVSKPAGTYEFMGNTYHRYNDPLPLNIEQFTDMDAKWSKRATYNETFLLSYGKYIQDSNSMNGNDYVLLEYTITDVKWNYLYEQCKKSVFNELKSGVASNTSYNLQKHLSTNSYEVYKVNSGYVLRSQYVILYDNNRIVTLNLSTTFNETQLESAIKLLEP